MNRSLLQAWATLGVVLLAVWTAGVPTGAFSLAASVALAGLAAVVAALVLRRHRTSPAAAPAGHDARRGRRLAPRAPSRLCDPDAAGHPRPRAPGR